MATIAPDGTFSPEAVLARHAAMIAGNVRTGMSPCVGKAATIRAVGFMAQWCVVAGRVHVAILRDGETLHRSAHAL